MESNGVLLRRIDEAIASLNGILAGLEPDQVGRVEIQRRLGHLVNARRHLLGGAAEDVIMKHVRLSFGFDSA